MNKTQIVKCNCKHEFQDEKNGIGMRFTTPANGKQQAKFFVVRCTVCGKEHSLGSLK